MLATTRLFVVKLSPGELIDQKYRILRKLGTGGMGSVYEAENIRVDRRVAIKVMHKVRDQQDVVRFEREARAAQIGSPHIVQVFDLGYLADGAPYMVMEYLAGETLGARLQRVGCLTPEELLPIARQILDGLSAAHRAGIIHRDLKPDNVFLVRVEGSDEEVVKLLDFGISKFTDTARKAADVSLTRSGVAVGTPHYMSPEQVQGSKALDTRTDLYSLGVILYRCLSGHLPFQSEDVAPLLVQILLEAPKPVHEVHPGIDPELSAIIARSMARQAADRFQTAAEFRAALTAWEAARSGVGASVAMLAGKPATPFNVQPMGTNAPWSSTASHRSTPPRTIRNVALAAAFLLAGIAGLVVAYQIWRSGGSQPDDAVTSSSATRPVTVTTAAVASVEGPSILPVNSASLAEPSGDLELPVRSENAQLGSGRVHRSPIKSVASATPATSSMPAPPAPPPKAPPPQREDGADNRHMSRGVR